MAYQPKSYRKFLAGTVSAAVVASAIAPVASASFTDVAGSVHADDIATLVAKGYIKGYSDGTFKPDKSLTRGEAAIIFSRILKDAGVTAKGAGFPDVPASKAELAEAVAIVQAAGIMTGDEKGNFNPNANITREQMAKVVVEAFKLTKPANYTTKVTDLDKAAPWAREYIQVLEANGVTKNTEFMPKRNVTRGQFASFVVRAMDAQEPVTVEAEVATVSAINNTTFELNVTFKSEVTEALLKGTKLTLTGPVTVTATFSKLDGQTAVYKVDNVGALQPGNGSADGTYKVTSTSVKVPDGTVTTYGEVLTGNQIKGFVNVLRAGKVEPVKNATVEVNGRTVKTDDYGFYSVTANSGERVVKVTAPGYFSKTVDVKVSRNYVTASNVTLNPYNQGLLQIQGVAMNDEKSTPIDKATVELYEKQNGSYVKVAAVKTGPDGKFMFANKDVAVSSGSGVHKFSVNELDIASEYKIVITKGLSSNNFTDVYHQKEVEFKLAQDQADTNLKNVRVTPVKELNKATFDLTWSPKAIQAIGEAQNYKVQVDLLDKDGKTVLVSNVNLGDLRSADDNRVMVQPYDMVGAGTFFKEGGNSVKPRIPSGTYFLRVKDFKGSNQVNATTVIPLTVTEGQDAAAAKTEIKEAKTYNLQSLIGNVKYEEALPENNQNVKVLDKDGQRTTDDVTVKYTVTQKVAGVDVEVGLTESSSFVYSGENKTITGTSEIKYLIEGVEYTATPHKEFIRGNATTFTAGGALSTGTATYSSAAKITDLTIDQGQQTDIANGSKLVVNSIQLIDKSGNVVAQTNKYTVTVSYNNSGKANLLDSDEAVRLSGIAPGEYKVRINIAGYKPIEVPATAKKVLDFQRAEIVVDKKLEKIPATSLSGYIRYADNNANVADADNATVDATVVVVNEDGKVVAGYDFGKTVNESVYKIVDGKNGTLSAGRYTVIVRGPGFETIEKTITVEEGKENIFNFEVERGGKGKVKLAIRDENNNGYTGSANGIKLTDSKYADYAGDSLNLTYIGVYGGTLAQDKIEFSSIEALSRGTYTLKITETSVTYAYTSTITLVDKNDTFYGLVSLKNIVGGKTIPLTVNFSGDDGSVDYVVVKKGDTVVVVGHETTQQNSVTVRVGANDEYTVEVYSNGKFVGSNKVTVQDFAKSVTVALDQATRD
ncbi:S-layer homology domain-containing protein [Anoxybacillus sp. ST4]|uniref:S-layer homology domain-containing protein n=1 Tax=Anoxybacillus sp. ST4 TaxID=2864181 RepID=UPI002102DC9F|nr:S-layer homology domain-containing protein [Anoxybacillus sp. ST4]